MIYSNFRKYLTITSLLMAVLCIQNASFAQNQSSVSVSLAAFNLLGSDLHSVESRIEYRFNLLDADSYPFSGIMANSSGAYFIYSGWLFDIFVTDELVVTPSFATGVWETGSSKDLNFLFEFRSQIEIAFVLNDESRIGISFNHISNGGLGRSNPGVESLAASYISPMQNILDIFEL